MDYIADTGFLIGRWRGGKACAEEAFIARHPDASLLIPWVVKAEFLRGALIARHDAGQVLAFLGRFKLALPDDDTIALYARTYMVLYRANHLIGPHDLWIAAAGLQRDIPLLTRNVAEFRKVPGLRVADYAAPHG